MAANLRTAHARCSVHPRHRRAMQHLVEIMPFVITMPDLQTAMPHVCRAWACVSLSFEWHAPQD